MQIIHALVALPLDAGIICTSDLWEIQNTLLIIRCHSMQELFAQVVSGRFVPDTSHEWIILVLTLQSLSIDIPDSSKHAKI